MPYFPESITSERKLILFLQHLTHFVISTICCSTEIFDKVLSHVIKWHDSIPIYLLDANAAEQGASQLMQDIQVAFSLIKERKLKRLIFAVAEAEAPGTWIEWFTLEYSYPEKFQKMEDLLGKCFNLSRKLREQLTQPYKSRGKNLSFTLKFVVGEESRDDLKGYDEEEPSYYFYDSTTPLSIASIDEVFSVHRNKM